MSPEQAAAERELGPRSDLYVLGCVPHELLTGQPPFSGLSGWAGRLTAEAPDPATREESYGAFGSRSNAKVGVDRVAKVPSPTWPHPL